MQRGSSNTRPARVWDSEQSLEHRLEEIRRGPEIYILPWPQAHINVIYYSPLFEPLYC